MASDLGLRLKKTEKVRCARTKRDVSSFPLVALGRGVDLVVAHADAADSQICSVVFAALTTTEASKSSLISPVDYSSFPDPPCCGVKHPFAVLNTQVQLPAEGRPLTEPKELFNIGLELVR